MRGNLLDHLLGLQEEDSSDDENSDVECTSNGYGALSAYELERLENIRQNQAFLSSIKLLQATEDLKQSVRPKPTQQGLMRSKAAVREVPPPRKSLRLQNKEAETLMLPPELRGVLTYEHSQPSKKSPGPLPMVPVNMEEGSRLPPQLPELCSEDIESREAESGITQTTMGIYAVRVEGAGPGDKPFADVGVVIEGVEVLQNLQSVTMGCVMLFGLIYALNLSYPKNLKSTFEMFPDGTGHNQAFTKSPSTES